MAIEVLRLKFRGTPRDFGVTAELLGWKLLPEYGMTLFHVWETRFSKDWENRPEVNPLEVMFCDVKGKQLGWIRAQQTGVGTWLTVLVPKKDDWAALKDSWELLRAELEQQGWLDEPAEAQADRGAVGEPKMGELPESRPPGRPRGLTPDRRERILKVALLKGESPPDEQLRWLESRLVSRNENLSSWRPKEGERLTNQQIADRLNVGVDMAKKDWAEYRRMVGEQNPPNF